MGFINWGNPVTVSGLLVGAATLVGSIILYRFKLNYDAKLEQVKADLYSKETEIVALRSGALATATSRQIAVDKRRIEAIDQVWSAVCALAPARAIAQIMSSVKYDVASQRAVDEPKFRQMFAEIGSNYNLNINTDDAFKAKPYLSPMTWAIYSALVGASMHAVMQFHTITHGAGKADWIDTEAINGLLKTVVPEHTQLIDQFGPASYFHLLQILEAKLLYEIQSTLNGSESDVDQVDTAAKIVEYSHKVMGEYRASQESESAES